jgi:hypothetical protein
VLERALGAAGELRDTVAGQRPRIRDDRSHGTAEAFDEQGRRGLPVHAGTDPTGTAAMALEPAPASTTSPASPEREGAALPLDHCGGGELRVIATILKQQVIERILCQLGPVPQPPPKGRARKAGQDSPAWFGLAGSASTPARPQAEAATALRDMTAARLKPAGRP